jgi:streptogramin lyase
MFAVRAVRTITFVSLGTLLISSIARPQTQAQTPAASGCATEYTAGFHGKPAGLLGAAADGNLWMTEQHEDQLAMFDPRTLTVTEYPLPAGTLPHDMTTGPDGNPWFTALSDKIGRVDLKTKQITFFHDGITPGSYPHVLIVGPDGNIWFTEQGAYGPPDVTPPGPQGHTAIAQLDLKTGMVTEYSAGLPPGNLIHTPRLGPDGNIWVTLEGVDQIARFNLATRTFDQFVHFSPGSGPHNMILGPDGDFYVALSAANRLGQYDPRTGQVREFPTSVAPNPMLPSLLGLVVGPDKKSIWFTFLFNGRIGRFDLTTSQITEFTCGIRPGADPLDIEIGPDNNLWFTEIAVFPDPTIPGGVARFVPPAGP